MRVAIGGIMQESNSFAARAADLRDFEEGGLWRGNTIIERMRGTSSEVGGFIAAAEQAGVTLVPTLRAWSLSAGPLPAPLYRHLEQELLEGIRAALPVDGVLLALHGAMVAEGLPSADGDLLAAVRRLIGPDVPIAASLDLHANLTTQMVANADILAGYRTYPHIDHAGTGRRAANLLFAMLRGDIRPSMALAKVPMIVPAENMQTQHGPMARLFAAAGAIEQSGNALSTSLFPVQPWLDVPEPGFAALVITDNNPQAAQAEAERLAQLAWQLRDDFFIPKLGVAEAVQYALRAPAGPVILADLGDATGGGATGDSAAVLAELLPHAGETTALLTLVDAPAVAKACELGPGANIEVQVGGSLDPRFYHPVTIQGRVRALTDGRYTFKGPTYTGLEIECGRTAVIQQGGIRVVVTEHPAWAVDPSFYRSVGQEPAEMKIVAVKSPNQFRAGYTGMAAEIVLVNSPGPCSADLPSLPYSHTQRPLFPLDRFD